MPSRGAVSACVLLLTTATLLGCVGAERPLTQSPVAVAHPFSHADRRSSDAAVANTKQCASGSRHDKRPRRQPGGDSGPVVQLSFESTDTENELTPDKAVAVALAANPDLKSAQQQVAHASAVLDGFHAERFPQVRVSERYAVTDNPNQVFAFLQNQARLRLGGADLATAEHLLNNPATTNNFHTQLALEHSIYTGGRRSAQTQAAELRRDASESALAAVQNELVFQVIEAYYRLLQSRELVQVRREAVAQVERHLDDVRARHRAGTAVNSDVLSVQVRLAEVQELLISARNQTKLAWAVLENVVGASFAGWTLPETVPEAQWAADFDHVETAVAEALQARPEVFQLEREINAAEHDVRAAQAGKYPNVDFLGSYDVYTGDLSEGNASFFVGLAVGLNLFDAGRTKSAERQARAQVGRLRAQSERLFLDIELGVRRASLQLDDARQRAEVTRSAVSHAQASLREIEARYRGEMSTLTEMIDAQVALSNARVRDVQARADVEVARSALARAVGRLVDAFRG